MLQLKFHVFSVVYTVCVYVMSKTCNRLFHHYIQRILCYATISVFTQAVRTDRDNYIKVADVVQ